MVFAQELRRNHNAGLFVVHREFAFGKITRGQSFAHQDALKHPILEWGQAPTEMAMPHWTSA
jgi:hypothetical protein